MTGKMGPWAPKIPVIWGLGGGGSLGGPHFPLTPVMGVAYAYCTRDLFSNCVPGVHVN